MEDIWRHARTSLVQKVVDIRKNNGEQPKKKRKTICSTAEQIESICNTNPDQPEVTH